jgi:hypothetical protein
VQESRNQIKARLLKNASRTWGYTETESENNFDPLVSMLMTACAAELEKISGEIQASRARVLERLVQLLSPDALTGVIPAHAVATATPIDNIFELSEQTQFYSTKKKIGNSEMDETVSRDYYFSPTADFRLTKASIRFMAAGNSLYSLSNQVNKEIIAQTEAGKELPSSSLWLAIDEPSQSLNQTMFFFDLRNEAGKQLFYQQLPKAAWYWNDQTISHRSGYSHAGISGEKLSLETVLNRDDDVSAKIKKHVNSYYHPLFITLEDMEDLTSSKENALLTGIIADSFSHKSLEPLKKYALRWICIDFPKTVSTDLLQDVICVMNCFPVINRKMHEFSFRLQEFINIIPLTTDDIFLDLEGVDSDEGKLLNVRRFEQTGEEKTFAMLLRNGGVGRFDERDAGTIVSYVLQLLRDESAAFSTLGNDFMSGEMKQLQQIINKLEQRMFSRQLKKEQTPYLVIQDNLKANRQNIAVHYWSTTGEDANNIKSGTLLRLYKGTGVEYNHATFVTTSIGGRDKLGTTETVLAYKSALLSRDRLITAEDIKTFCHYELGERVKSIEVQKGIMIHSDQQQGFVKTIDIIISIHRRAFDEMMERGELEFWKTNLKLLLEEKSMALFPYRVIIEKAA